MKQLDNTKGPLLAIGRIWVFFLFVCMAFLFGWTATKGMILNNIIAGFFIIVFLVAFLRWSEIWESVGI